MGKLEQNNPKISAARLLYDNVHDFKSAAQHVESEIRRLGICYNGWETVPAMEGRTHHEAWVSLKTVSHFNLGTALELMLKLMLSLDDVPIDDIPRGQRHSLVHLYDKLPDQHQLEVKYRACRRANNEMKFVAFFGKLTDEAELEYRSPGTQVIYLRGLFEYLDEIAKLWKMRYSWELMRDKKWRYYLNDISILIDLINSVMSEIPRDELLLNLEAKV